MSKNGAPQITLLYDMKAVLPSPIFQSTRLPAQALSLNGNHNTHVLITLGKTLREIDRPVNELKVC